MRNHHINELGQVVPYVCGRLSTNTESYRDLTDFESELLSEIEEINKDLKRSADHCERLLDEIEELKARTHMSEERMQGCPAATCSASSELIDNLHEWGDHFRQKQHGATLTILRARKTILDQAERIAWLENQWEETKELLHAVGSGRVDSRLKQAADLMRDTMRQKPEMWNYAINYYESISSQNDLAMTAPRKSPLSDRALPALVISDLLALGFKLEPATGRFWHWSESPGIELIDGKWFPCDMFYNGDMQYSDDGYESPVDAAKQAVRFFS